MRHVAGILAFLTGAAGWYYLFYSPAAKRLEGIEQQALNERRIRYRQAGGVAMLLLGGFLFAGSYAFGDPGESPVAFLAVWATVAVLLIVIVVLAMVDVRLTRRLREERTRRRGLDVE